MKLVSSHVNKEIIAIEIGQLGKLFELIGDECNKPLGESTTNALSLISEEIKRIISTSPEVEVFLKSLLPQEIDTNVISIQYPPTVLHSVACANFIKNSASLYEELTILIQESSDKITPYKVKKTSLIQTLSKHEKPHYWATRLRGVEDNLRYEHIPQELIDKWLTNPEYVASHLYTQLLWCEPNEDLWESNFDKSERDTRIIRIYINQEGVVCSLQTVFVRLGSQIDQTGELSRSDFISWIHKHKSDTVLQSIRDKNTLSLNQVNNLILIDKELATTIPGGPDKVKFSKNGFSYDGDKSSYLGRVMTYYFLHFNLETNYSKQKKTLIGSYIMGKIAENREITLELINDFVEKHNFTKTIDKGEKRAPVQIIRLQIHELNTNVDQLSERVNKVEKRVFEKKGN